MILTTKFPITALLILIITGCSSNSGSIFSKDNIPFVHRINIQQGNVITQEMLAKLEPGMDKKKVRFIMGTPLINDTFHSERWDYIYTYKYGRDQREQRRVTLFFEDQLLARVSGDVNPARGEIALERKKMQSVEVPPAPPKGLFARVKDKISIDDDKPKLNKTVEDLEKEVEKEYEITSSDDSEQVAETALDLESEEEEAQDFEPTTSQKSLFDTMWEGGEPQQR